MARPIVGQFELAKAVAAFKRLSKNGAKLSEEKFNAQQVVRKLRKQKATKLDEDLDAIILAGRLI